MDDQMTGSLPQLPKIFSLFTQEIHLNLPFDQAAARFAGDPGTVVLLSGSDLDCARYNCLAVDPWLEIKGRGQEMSLGFGDNSFGISQDPFDLLQALLHQFKVEPPAGILGDLPVAAGFFGYFSYDLKDQIEDLPRTCADTFLPDICLFAPSILMVQDKKTGTTHLSIPIFSPDDSESYISRKKEGFFRQLDQAMESGAFSIDRKGFSSSFSKEGYVKAVNRIIDYLKAGDIYQANLSQRFETGFQGDAYGLFQELFKRNPASFFSFVHSGDHKIVSTSPERFIKVDGRDVETRPIKGTIARGNTPETDKENGRILAKSIKDDAELTMIVDLMRNDVSRVTEQDSVRVSQHKRLEPYENVFHLVSVVQGRLGKDKTAVDLLKATFPGGSITGCPKIRSMEIIDELESVRRHVYTGSIGYLSFHGTMDLSIAIRTATITDGSIFFSVGGGIVYDSDPEKEFQETLDKGKTLMETLMAASSGSPEPPLLAWSDGRLMAQDQVMVPAMSPGFQYGAGLFETIRVEAGRPCHLKAHLLRMNEAWIRLFGSVPPDITWDRIIEQLVRENRLEKTTCAVKLMAAKKGAGNALFLAAFIRPYTHRLDAAQKSGLDLVSFPHPRQTFLADHKTLNYLYYDRAGQFAKENHGDEAIILNPDLSVSETNTCNIFAIDNNTLILPDSPHVLPGVTLGVVLTALSKQGYDVIKERVTPKDLAGYGNVLVTNALMGAVMVNSIDGVPVTHDPGICPMVNALL